MPLIDAIACKHCGNWHSQRGCPCNTRIAQILHDYDGQFELHGVIECPLWDGDRNLGEAVLSHIKEGTPLPAGIIILWQFDAALDLILKMRFGARGHALRFSGGLVYGGELTFN